MAAAAVGVGRRQRSRVTAMTQRVLPLALAPTGSDRRLGFVGHCTGTVNIGSCAPGVPLLYGTVREGGPLSQERQAPPIRARDENLS
jgi:hypothetical protein